MLPVSCYEFEQSSFTYSTHIDSKLVVPSLITFTAKLFKVEGRLQVPSGYKISTVQVLLRNLINQSTKTVTGLYDSADHSIIYDFFATPADRYEITPIVSGSSALVFYPTSRLVYLDSIITAATLCPIKLPEFTGKVGVFLEGVVAPAISQLQVFVDGSVSGRSFKSVCYFDFSSIRFHAM